MPHPESASAAASTAASICRSPALISARGAVVAPVRSQPIPGAIDRLRHSVMMKCRASRAVLQDLCDKRCGGRVGSARTGAAAAQCAARSTHRRQRSGRGLHCLTLPKFHPLCSPVQSVMHASVSGCQYLPTWCKGGAEERSHEGLGHLWHAIETLIGT